MATTEELFISISPQSYLKNKSAILMCQSDLLKALKRLQNIKVLTTRRNDYKKQFFHLLSAISKRTELIQNKLPTPQVPKIFSHKDKIVAEHKKENKKTFSKRDEIEEELQSIQAKLKELNS